MVLRTDSEIIIQAIAIRRAELVPEKVLFRPSNCLDRGKGLFMNFSLKFSFANSGVTFL